MKIKPAVYLLAVILVALPGLACGVLSGSTPTGLPPGPEKPNPTSEISDTLIPTIFSPTDTLLLPPRLPGFVYVARHANSVEIYGSQIDGSQLIQITNSDKVYNWNPAFSPDCTQLVYQADITGAMLLYILQLGSDQPPRLLTSADQFADAELPSWSPDGETIAFAGSLQGENGETIFTIRSDGSDLKRLTEMHPPGKDDCPSWSPDGQTIAFLTTPTGEADYLTLMNPDGSNRRSLLSILFPPYGCPSWSPDGSRMAIVIPGVQDRGDIAILSKDGSGLVNLTNSADQDWEPAWSPDGKTIAFMNSLPGQDYDFNIFLMNMDGSAMTPLFNSPVSEHEPAYCPLPSQ